MQRLEVSDQTCEKRHLCKLRLRATRGEYFVEWSVVANFYNPYQLRYFVELTSIPIQLRNFATTLRFEIFREKLCFDKKI